MGMLINIKDYEEGALRHLSLNAAGYYQSGAWDEKTLKANCEDFNQYVFHPRVLRDVSKVDTSATLFDQEFPLPFGVAPSAFHKLAHPAGEAATAAAAMQHQVPAIFSTLGTVSMEEIGKIFTTPNQKPWFQLYVHKNRILTEDLIRRAEASGFKALVFTVDAPQLGDREADHRNHFSLPPDVIPVNVSKSLPKMCEDSSLMEYFSSQIDPSLTFKTIDWLRNKTKLPVVVKGILRADDAKECIAHGASAIYISNHGGRQLDGDISTIRALDLIAPSLEETDIPIFFDGGVRRGIDILKALALGASAVFVGRPVLWGLTVAGQYGVEDVLSILKKEFILAMKLAGCASLSEINRDLISLV